VGKSDIYTFLCGTDGERPLVTPRRRDGSHDNCLSELKMYGSEFEPFPCSVPYSYIVLNPVFLTFTQ
jgi:hypothetical protein